MARRGPGCEASDDSRAARARACGWLLPRGASQEMSSVQAELKFAEQKLRHEMREELELQVNFQERRCADKISFIRAKMDAHVAHVRNASHAKARAEVTKTRREERAVRETLASESVSSVEKLHAEEIVQLNELQRQYIVRMQELQVENKNLHARIRTHDEAIAAREHEARRVQHRDVQVISSLEQQLTAKEQEIQMLREQLAAVKAPLVRSAPVAPPPVAGLSPVPTLRRTADVAYGRPAAGLGAHERDKLLAAASDVGDSQPTSPTVNPQLTFGEAFDDDDDDDDDWRAGLSSVAVS